VVRCCFGEDGGELEEGVGDVFGGDHLRPEKEQAREGEGRKRVGND